MKLQESAILTRFSAGMPGDARTDKILTEDVKVDKHLGTQAGRWVKQLFPKEALLKCKEIVGRARTTHYNLSLPFDDSGFRILPTTTYLDYQTEMRKLHQEFDAAREEFNSKWDEWVAWAKVEHNGSFNAANYDKAKAYRMFKFNCDFNPIPEGGDFRVALQEEDVATMKRDLDERLTEKLAEAQADLWQRLLAPVKAMCDKLGDGNKIFRNTLVENLSNIVALIPKLNIAGDNTLNDLAQECNTKLLKHTADTLREVPSARQATAKDADAILKRLEGLMPKAAE